MPPDARAPARRNVPMIRLTGPGAPVRSVDFLPDGRHLVSAAGASTAAWVWDVRTGRVAGKLFTPLRGRPPDRARDRVRCAAALADGTVVAKEDIGGLTVWSWPGGTVVRDER